ncbi:hypothetical protein B566_EDAN001607 [Ephemera danica]|nr:hypothetical protein B566_EDAN001607 [Ephemera danica]
MEITRKRIMSAEHNPEIIIEPSTIYFKGVGGTEMKTHEKSKTNVRARNIEIILKKKEEGPFWPHLTKSKQKYHWLKVDFGRWRDEDDSEEEMGGAGEDDFPNSPGGDAKPSFDELDQESDSDDENMPDLE